MEYQKTRFPGLLILRPKIYRDDRGFFFESFNQEVLKRLDIRAFEQDNHSGSKKGVLRGLHFQYDPPQGKLIRCIRGEIFDVAVDIRKGSPAFGRWFSIILREDEHLQLWLPAGFAHGFLALSGYAEVQYKCTSSYNPASDSSIRYDDPDIGIEWPFGAEPLVSEKDKKAISFKEYLASPKFSFSDKL